jgi:hypothetical protein
MKIISATKRGLSLGDGIEDVLDRVVREIMMIEAGMVLFDGDGEEMKEPAPYTSHRIGSLTHSLWTNRGNIVWVDGNRQRDSIERWSTLVAAINRRLSYTDTDVVNIANLLTSDSGHHRRLSRKMPPNVITESGRSEFHRVFASTDRADPDEFTWFMNLHTTNGYGDPIMGYLTNNTTIIVDITGVLKSGTYESFMDVYTKNGAVPFDSLDYDQDNIAHGEVVPGMEPETTIMSSTFNRPSEILEQLTLGRISVKDDS